MNDIKNNDTTTYYEKAQDGKFYQPFEAEDGEVFYEPAPEGLDFHELGSTGRYVEVKDLEELAKQRANNSHLSHFTDPKTAKQRIKSQDALQRQFEVMSADMRVPPTGPNVEYIKDEQFMDYQSQYAKAKAAGQERDCEFQPLSSYHHKLVTNGGKVIRPVFQGEVGMKGNTTICLEQGYGRGAAAQVK